MTKYVVIFNRTISVGSYMQGTPRTIQQTEFSYFDDLKSAAEFSNKRDGVLLKAVEYDVTETESKDDR